MKPIHAERALVGEVIGDSAAPSTGAANKAKPHANTSAIDVPSATCLQRTRANIARIAGGGIPCDPGDIPFPVAKGY